VHKTKKSDEGFILHTKPWRETSLLCEVFTKEHGRLRFSAKGARSPRSALRGSLIAFHRFEISWRGSGEMLTISGIDWLHPIGFLNKTALIAGYYLNELILQLLAYADSHQKLFDVYASTIEMLYQQNSHSEKDQLLIETILRRFEVLLLQEIGYGLRFGEIVKVNGKTQAKVIAGDEYVYILAKGVFPQNQIPKNTSPSNIFKISGKALLELEGYKTAEKINFPSNKQVLNQQKLLLRTIINNTLLPNVLYTRRLMSELKKIRN